jgi:hypothetical protein
MGVAFWFLGALTVRAASPYLPGPLMFLIYALTIPAAWLLNAATQRLARIHPEDFTAAIAYLTGVAVMCDGVALVLIPELYGSHTANGAAWILWFGGAGLIWAVFMGRRLPR